MKWLALASLAALASFAVPVFAQEMVPVGNIAKVDNPAPMTWAMSGWNIVHIAKSDGSFTPIMRTELFDARTVEILSRTQVPPLRRQDIRAVGNKVIVRRFLLMTVRPQDARAEGLSETALARKWAASTARVLPQIAPLPSRFGV